MDMLALLLFAHVARWGPGQLDAAVRRSGVLEGRELRAARRVCDLSIAGVAYPVIVTEEDVPAIEPRRSYSHVLVLTPSGRRASSFPLIPPAEVDRCRGNRLTFRKDTVSVAGICGSAVRFGRGATLAWIENRKDDTLEILRRRGGPGGGPEAR